MATLQEMKQQLAKKLQKLPLDNKIKIRTINGGLIQFTGRYRPDLEATNWHYWEKAGGTMIHIKKVELIYVEGETVEAIILNKEIKELMKAIEHAGQSN